MKRKFISNTNPSETTGQKQGIIPKSFGKTLPKWAVAAQPVSQEPFSSYAIMTLPEIIWDKNLINMKYISIICLLSVCLFACKSSSGCNCAKAKTTLNN
jgi:hypothetical protein